MAYKRLTKRDELLGRTYRDECFGCEDTHCATCPINGSVWERLAELEDKIEQGTLKEIPCKIGDTLYTNIRWQGDYMRKENAPYPVTVVFIGINDNVDMGGGVINIVNEKGRMWQIDFLDIGKTVFRTREEAKNA